MAQASLWDVDGTGLQPVGNADVASAILKKVNSMNLDIGLKSVAVTIALAALPDLVQLFFPASLL